MGNTVSQIGSAISNGAKSAANLPSDIVTGNTTQLGKDATGAFTGLSTTGLLNSPLINAATGANNQKPATATVDPALQTLENNQINQANAYRAGAGALKSSQGQMLRNQANAGLNSNLNSINSSNSSRGLLYGGINQGQKSNATSQSQNNLATNISKNNTAIDQQANQYDANALSTAAAIQGNQQAINNAAYAQAMAQQSSQNAVFTGLLSTAATAAILA